MDKKEKAIITEKDFMAYEKIRNLGAFNMLSPEAREMTGLDYDTYVELVSNYSNLAKKYLNRKDDDREFGEY